MTKKVINEDVDLPRKASLSENFDLFIDNFSSNKAYQISRIKFPLKDCQYIGQYATPCFKISIEEWNHVVLNDSTEFQIETYDDLKDSDFDMDKYQRILSKVETNDSNCLKYYFNLQENKWRLTQILRCSE